MARPTSARQQVPSTSTTATITLESTSTSDPQQPQIRDALVLKLKRPKKVSWKEGTVDNEFMNKKSSKKCCIFHKEKPFDEDDSDAEGDCDHDHDHDHDNHDRDDHDHQERDNGDTSIHSHVDH